VAQTSWPQSTGTERTVDDDQYEVLGRAFGPSGVLQAIGDTDVVYGDSSGRHVKIRHGKNAYVIGQGWASDPTTDEIVAIAANTSGSTRYDLVVLRVTRSTWVTEVAVVAGTPGSGIPLTTHDVPTSGVWEIPLAYVIVTNGAATITAGNVINLAPLIDQSGNAIYPNSNSLIRTVDQEYGLRAPVNDSGLIFESNGTNWLYAAGQELEWGKRDLTSGGSTVGTEVEVLRLPVRTVYAGQTLDVSTTPLFIYSTVAGDTVSARLRYTTNGTNPTTASSVLCAGQRRLSGAGIDESVELSRTFRTTATTTLVLLLTVKLESGSGTAQILYSASSGKRIEITVRTYGKSVAESGVVL